jgi:hypothetical protein
VGGADVITHVECGPHAIPYSDFSMTFAHAC